MNKAKHNPNTLLEAIRFFSDLDVCHAYLAKIKWPDGRVTCPKCGSDTIGMIASRRMFQCKDCRKQFSVKVGTIFEDSPLGLDKWFVAVWSITNAKNGISSCELARAIGVTQKSAWHMLHRVRHAMHTGSFSKFTGEVESDESFIGGLSINMHQHKRAEKIKGGGSVGKTVVMGLLQRNIEKGKSRVRAKVVDDTRRKTLQPIVEENVAKGSNVYTDSLPSYGRLMPDYIHEVIDHTECYVRGRVHTNGLENFWSLLKRAISGTYVAVDAPHLQRYVDEQVFRFNEREREDGGRFATVMPGVVGRRLTYKALIGHNTPENLSPSDEVGNGAEGLN